MSLISAQWTEVIPLEGFEPWLVAAIQKVLRLRDLPENWDGEGGPEIQQRSLLKAVQLLQYLEVEDLPVPLVAPIPGGGLQLEWGKADRELEIEILPDGSILYLTDQDGEMNSGDIPCEKEVDFIRQLLHWVFDE